MSTTENRIDLTTDCLVLRPWSTGEIAAVTGGHRLPHWAPDFPAEGDRMIAGHLAADPARQHGYGHRQIVERATGLVVGAIGMFWPPADGVVEFGYGVVRSRRRRGYATEAARAIVAFALAAPGVREVVADVDPTNPASVRVLEKAGLHRSGTDGHSARADGPVDRYAITAAELSRR